MENIEEKLGTILNDPKMMQQIMSLAQTLGSNSSEPQPPAQNPPNPPQNRQENPGMDLAMIQKLSGLAGSGSIDKDQKQLLQALSPYLSTDRVSKLENAMRAAKIARMASAFLSGGGLQMLGGR